MSNKEILESGLLELYALGLLAEDEYTLVEKALASDPMLKEELAQLEEAYLVIAQANAVTPNPTIKPLLMAKVDYMNRLRNGEVPESVPVLGPDSTVTQFQQWLNRDDMQLSPEFSETQVSIISDEADKMTAIVWLKSGAPPETHVTEYEKFLIVEGTCDLTVGTNIHALQPGDYLCIPLHVSHNVRVTSQVPCKIILQRQMA